MNQNMTDRCPDANDLAEFVEGRLLKAEHEDVFLHVAGCSYCRDLCAFAAKELAKEKSGKKPELSLKLKQAIRTHIGTLLGNDSQQFAVAVWEAFCKRIIPIFDSLEQADVVAASGIHSTLVFSSVSKNATNSWKMQLLIPTQIEKTLDIVLEVPGTPEINGTLILCGNEVDIRHGKGTIEYSVLRKSFSNPEVAFIFPNGEKVVGYPEI